MFRRLTALALVAGLGGTPVALADPPSHFDENALRYYAALGQKDRVAAEAARLRRLDPDWHMPTDLETARPGGPDEGPLWALYGQDRLDELDKAVALRQATEPTWQPSEDLMAKVRVKRLRAKILDLAQAKDWRAVVTSAKASGIAWAKDDAEALWIIAEAYAHGGDCGEAFVVYRSILASHSDPNERRATIEHAIAFLPMTFTEKLIAMGHSATGDGNEFDPIAIEITQARIAAFLHDTPSNEISDTELTRFEDHVRASADSNLLGLVAWYAFKRHDYPQALDWFKLAIGQGGDAMIAHGLAHTLRKLGMKREAEEVAYAWREPLVNNSILFIDLLEEDFTKAEPAFIEPARVSRYAQVTMETESGEGAQALGWYAYNTCQYPSALQWFERAVAWLPKEATVYGYALALQRMHRTQDFRDIVNRYDGLFPKVVALAFEDGIQHPPSPCDTARKRPIALHQIVPEDANGAGWVGRTMADTLLPHAESKIPRPNVGRAMVPSPDAIASGDTGLATLKKKTDFPFAVRPENPLRFVAAPTKADGSVVRSREAFAPLVARRVPGVGAMPYERFGFTLWPGWDGTKDPSSPTAAERDAPAGTLWALEQTLRDDHKAEPWPSGAPGPVSATKVNPEPNSLGQDRHT